VFFYVAAGLFVLGTWLSLGVEEPWKPRELVGAILLPACWPLVLTALLLVLLFGAEE
jgi:hypothetical protein